MHERIIVLADSLKVEWMPPEGLTGHHVMDMQVMEINMILQFIAGIGADTRGGKQ